MNWKTHKSIIVMAILAVILGIGYALSADTKHAPQAAEPGPALKMPGVVQASSFQLVDQNGTNRGGFAFDSDGEPYMYLADNKGRIRYSVYMHQNTHAHTTLYDKEGNAHHMDHVGCYTEKEEKTTDED